MPDYWENLYGLNSTVDEADEDMDHDGLTNLEEYTGGSDPSDRYDPNPKPIAPIIMLLLDSDD
jgi:hypothetical protein